MIHDSSCKGDGKGYGNSGFDDEGYCHYSEADVAPHNHNNSHEAVLGHRHQQKEFPNGQRTNGAKKNKRTDQQWEYRTIRNLQCSRQDNSRSVSLRKIFGAS